MTKLSEAAGALLQELSALKLDPLHPVSVMGAGLAYALLDNGDERAADSDAPRYMVRPDGWIVGEHGRGLCAILSVDAEKGRVLARRIVSLLNTYGE